MICVEYTCDCCTHQRENIDGWKCSCDAFPDGIPLEHAFRSDLETLKECNNGIGYEPKDK